MTWKKKKAAPDGAQPQAETAGQAEGSLSKYKKHLKWAIPLAVVLVVVIAAAALGRVIWGVAHYQSLRPLATYNALFVPLFAMAGLLCLVMSALFRQAAELKEDQDLTI